ncbi:MAG: alpha-amylase family glycosyl hydrolase [Oceanococcaceae bacterium]
MLSAPTPVQAQVEQHLQRIYGQADPALALRLCECMRLEPAAPLAFTGQNLWDAADIWAICYGDSVIREGEAPLSTLKALLDGPLAELLSGVHILPFYPFSSDHGFSVSDYDSVQPALGEWADITAIAADRRVMADLVINHCSSEHPWFRAFCAGEGKGADYFHVIPPEADLSAVVRPRTSDLRRPTPTAHGLAHVWCTFSHDQVDLNFANPEVLLEFVAIVRRLLDQGIRAFRLDAVAFLWKELGSNCLNLPQTHEIVRLLRTLVEAAAPDTILVTETNIPNRENLSYFGNGNEAHIVYNFSLPPLLLHTLLSGSCAHLKTWLMSMPPAQNGTTYLNFMASHDGIGLRPAEGLLSEEEIRALIDSSQRHGGKVSWRSLGGVDKPYEINIALFDALRGTHAGEDALQIERFVCAHAIMLGLEGLPAFYLNSLFATPNDAQRFARTGKNRSLNRHQWQADQLQAQLSQADSAAAQVLQALGDLIRIRRQQPAFHPNATQFTLHLGEELLGFWRQSMDRRQSIFCVSNITAQPQSLRLDRLNLTLTDDWQNLIGGRRYASLADVVQLAPYETVWIANTPSRES